MAASRGALILRSAPPAVAGGTLIVLLALLASDQGGYFPSTYLGAGAVAFAVAGLLLIARPPRRTLSGPALVAVAALAGLALWTGLSAGWSVTPITAYEDAQRAVVYLGLLGLGLLAAATGRSGRRLLWAALALVTGIALLALASRLLPDLVATPGGGVEDVRLAHPFGYWNALGALAALGIVVALGLAGDTNSSLPARAAAASAGTVLALTGYLSLSRGAWLALGAGALVLLLATPRRMPVLVAAVAVAVPAGLAIGQLDAYPALIERPDGGGTHRDAGRAFLPLAVLAVLVAGAVQGLVVAAGRRRRSPFRRGRSRPVLAAVSIVLVLAAVGAYVAGGSSIEGRAADRLLDADSFVDRQWREFWDPQIFSETGTERLRTSRGTRSGLYRVAWDGWLAAPIRGEGSGAFEVRWMRDRTVPEKVRDAHSLPLETLSELGVVGIVLLLAFLGAVAAAAVLACRGRTGLRRAPAAAAAAGFATWAVHAAIDWDWQMPALTGVALLLAATLCVPPRPPRVRTDAATT